jgi:uncharacterized coiled-coil protein SlyX
MNSVEEHDKRVKLLEKNVQESKKLLTELKQQFAAATDQFQIGKLEVNIEDVTKQLKDWEYELHALTQGKE